MDVGMIGLGKLGLPMAVAIARRGHRVLAYDSSGETVKRYRSGTSDLYEPMMDSRLKASLENGSLKLYGLLKAVVEDSELIFIAVQTPHAPELDGTQRYGLTKDFDYSYLIQACRQVAEAIPQDETPRAIAIISTVLPGTTRGLLLPAMKEAVGGEYRAPWDLYYNPSFVAMGQVESDFLRPEFALIGTERPGEAPTALLEFYTSIHHAPFHVMTWEEAELCKCAYNCFIGWKILTANTVMQMCEELGGVDCDAVLGALQSATNRIASGRYMRGGLGDGGPCHGRDSLAMASLSDRLGLKYNVFDFIMRTRERQAEWIADIMCRWPHKKVILGKTFKPLTNLTAGSPSILIGNILLERGAQVEYKDPVLTPHAMEAASVPAVYLVGTSDPSWSRWIGSAGVAPGSVVVDPWGLIEAAPEGVELLRVGRR